MKDSPALHRVEHTLFRGLKGGLRALPHAAVRTLGRALGEVAYAALGSRRRTAQENLALALPELHEAARRRLARQSFRHLGAALCDAISLSRFDLAGLCQRLTLEGWEHLQAARARRGGCFGLTAHLGHWEVAAHVTGAYFGPLHVVGRPLDNPLLDAELQALRQRFGNTVISKRGGVRRMLKAVTAGEMVGLLIDQRVKVHEGIWVPFFGQPALTTPFLAELSLRTGAPVVPIFCYPEPRGRYRFVARPAIEPPPGRAGEEVVAALTRRYLEVTEEAIRRHPGQWMWMHRRWKDPRRPG